MADGRKLRKSVKTHIFRRENGAVGYSFFFLELSDFLWGNFCSGAFRFPVEGGKHPQKNFACGGPVKSAFCIISIKHRNNTFKLLFLLPFPFFFPLALFSPSFPFFLLSFRLVWPSCPSLLASIPSRRFAPQIS